MNKYYVLVLMIFGSSIVLLSQSSTLKKADRFYNSNRYAEAIPLYKKILEEKESRSVQSKLARSYMKTNQLDNAALLYALLVQYETVAPRTYYDYAETLMSAEQYQLAKTYFQKYQAIQPNDEVTQLRIDACDKVHLIQPYFQAIGTKPIPFNSEADDNAPFVWHNKLYFTSDRNQGGFRPLEQKSSWTGRDLLRLYKADISEQHELQKPTPLAGNINELNKNTSNASISDDGLLIFSRNGDQTTKRSHSFNIQLYQSQYDGQNWKKEQKLDFCSKEYNYMHASISPDGNEIFFASDKPGGIGGLDIFYAQRTTNGWSRPTNLGVPINTSEHEVYPYYHHDGRLFFSSKGHAGFGGFDLFVTWRDEAGNWENPINLGRPLNSSYDDLSFYLDKMGESGYFSTTRMGQGDDIFSFERNKIAAKTSPEKTVDASPTPILISTTTTTPPSTENVTIDITTEIDSIDEVKKTRIIPDQTIPQSFMLAIGDTIRIDGSAYASKQFRIPPSVATQLENMISQLPLNENIALEIVLGVPVINDKVTTSIVADLRQSALKEYCQQLGVSSIRLGGVDENVTVAYINILVDKE